MRMHTRAKFIKSPCTQAHDKPGVMVLTIKLTQPRITAENLNEGLFKSD